MGLVIILIMAGILLLLAETFLIPGFGVAGILGVVSLAGSVYLSFTELSILTGIIVTVVDIVLVVGLILFFLRAKTWKKMELNTVIDSKGTPDNSVSVGARGRTVTRLAPMGTARIEEKSCEVTSLDGMMDAGSEIEVVRVEGNKIYVKQINS